MEDQLSELGERLFVQRIAGTIRPQARSIVKAHQRMGHTVVLASAATHFQVDPVARDLGVPNVLCSELESEDGVLTGRVRGKLLWGEPKAQAVRRFAREHDVDLSQLRLCQRRRGRAVPGQRRPAARDQPGPRTARGGGPAELAGAQPAGAAALGRARVRGHARRDRRASTPASASAAVVGAPGRPRSASTPASRSPATSPSPPPGSRCASSASRTSGSTGRRSSWQPPEQPRPGGRLAAAPGLHGGGQGGGQERPADPAATLFRAGVRRPLEPRAGARRDGQAGRPDPAGHLGDDLPRGHPDADPEPGRVQEGRLPPRDAGRGADGADRAPRRRRPDAAAREGDPPRVVDAEVLDPIPTDDWKAEDLDTIGSPDVRQLFVDTLETWPA